VADGILLGGAEFTEGAILIGGHEEGIVAEAFGADLGFEDPNSRTQMALTRSTR
jgi:hypothetical protein